jgi:hypothetical protein
MLAVLYRRFPMVRGIPDSETRRFTFTLFGFPQNWTVRKIAALREPCLLLLIYKMFLQLCFDILRDRGGCLVFKIVVNDYHRALDAESALLPRFVVDGKTFGPNAADSGMDLHRVLNVDLGHEIIVRMGHDKGPVIVEAIPIGDKVTEKGGPGHLEPLGQNHIVDVPQPVRIAEPGLNSYVEHSFRLLLFRRIFKSSCRFGEEFAMSIQKWLIYLEMCEICSPWSEPVGETRVYEIFV